jgi:DNA-binding IclR family transcriptional regulator
MDTLSGVGVVDKSVAVLRSLEHDGPAALADVQGRTGLPRATAHRLLAALEHHGLVRRDGEGRYALGLGLIALGRAAADAFPLADLARPVLVDLRDRTGESVQLFVRESAGRRCLVSLQSAHGLRWIVPEGIVLPLHVGSAGRLLSGEAGPDGWVASVEERESGVASVSAPVVDDQGDVVAAVSVSGPLGRMTRQPGERFGAEVVAAAERVSAAITPRSVGAAARPRPAAAGR